MTSTTASLTQQPYTPDDSHGYDDRASYDKYDHNA